jgi:hypothetical protein
VRPYGGPTDSNVIEISRVMTWISHPLFQYSKAAWDVVQRGERSKSYLSGTQVAPSISGNAYVEFFNPFNLETFLQLYWSRWSFNCPIIHKPSFDLTKVPTIMVFVIILIGALMSPNPEDSLNARMWLDIAEEAVFRHPILWGETQGPSEEGSEASLREKLNILQSAFLICVLQNWEGSDAARKRIRHQQFSAVVSVGFRLKFPRIVTYKRSKAARILGFARANHTNDIDLNQNYIDWPQFVFTEELIRYV